MGTAKNTHENAGAQNGTTDKAQPVNQSPYADCDIDFAKSLTQWQVSIDAYKPVADLLESLSKVEDAVKPALALLTANSSSLDLSNVLTQLTMEKAKITAENATLKASHDTAKACLAGNRQDSEVYEGLNSVEQRFVFKKVWGLLSTKSYSIEVSKALKEIEVHGLNSNLSLRSSIRQQNNVDGKAEKLVRLDVQSRKLVISIYALSGIVQRFTIEPNQESITHELLAVARGKTTQISLIHKGEPKSIEVVLKSILSLL